MEEKQYEPAKQIFAGWLKKEGYALPSDEIVLQRTQANNFKILLNGKAFGKCHYVKPINRLIGLKVFPKAIQEPTIQNFIVAKKIKVNR
ncbi:MAG: hypothetical protein R6U15_06530 [Candidatus Izemoplasmatales bacterium]